MKHNEFLEKEYDKFFTHIEKNDFTEKKQITTFIKWLFDKGFLDNMSDKDFEWFYEETDRIYLPLLTNHKITIGIDYWDLDRQRKYCRVGIDPSNCFNKISSCSIIERFPINSKREEKQFYKLLETLLDKKSNISKDWFRVASSSWYGSYHNYE